MEINAPQEWIEEANDLVYTALKKVALKLYKNNGDEVPFPLFLHVCLCMVISQVYASAPYEKEAERFVNQAHEEVKQTRKKKPLAHTKGKVG